MMPYNTFTTLERAKPNGRGQFRVSGQDPDTFKGRIFIAVRVDGLDSESLQPETIMALLNGFKQEIYKAPARELSFN